MNGRIFNEKILSMALLYYGSPYVRRMRQSGKTLTLNVYNWGDTFPTAVKAAMTPVKEFEKWYQQSTAESQGQL